MSNKKLFWVAFFTLSCCEFGQFAYSKNIIETDKPPEINNTSFNYCPFGLKIETSSQQKNGRFEHYIDISTNLVS